MSDKKIMIRGRYWSTNRKEDGTLDEKLFGYNYEDLELDFDSTALLIIDVYGQGFDKKDELPPNPVLVTKKLTLVEKEIINKNIKPALDIAREKNFKIIYIENNSDPYYEDDNHQYGIYTKRFWGMSVREMHSLDGGMLKYSKVVAPRKGEYIVKKRFYDAFTYTELDYLLKNLGIKNVICVGFLADGCLFFTLYEAYVHNYKVILLRDCTFAFEMNNEDYIKNFTRTKHHIETVEIFIGHTITSNEFIKSCKNL